MGCLLSDFGAAMVLLHGRYQLQSQLGSGGYGEVSRALDTQSGEQVAIKRCHSGGNSDRFLRECELLCSTAFRTHQFSQHVVQGREFFQEAGESYLIMDLVEGETLDHSAFQNLPLRKALKLTLSILDGIEFLHSIDCIHRDLKPKNLIFSSQLGPYFITIVDLGIASANDGKDLTTTSTPGFGTRRFSAPECFLSPKETSPATDLYSLGALLYYFLTGEPPAFELFLENLRRYPTDFMRWAYPTSAWQQSGLETLLPHLPSTLCEFISKCLHKDASDRPQTCSECRSLLEGELKVLDKLREQKKAIRFLRKTLLKNISDTKHWKSHYTCKVSTQNLKDEGQRNLRLSHTLFGGSSGNYFSYPQDKIPDLIETGKHFSSLLQLLGDLLDSLDPSNPTTKNLDDAIEGIELAIRELLRLELALERALTGIV